MQFKEFYLKWLNFEKIKLNLFFVGNFNLFKLQNYSNAFKKQ